MKIIRDICSFPAFAKASADGHPDKKVILTMGNFDGIHLGHQSIFNEMKKEADRINGQTVVLTFEPHPMKFLAPEKELLLLTPFHEKMELLEKSGIDVTICTHFNREFANISPEDFIEKILYKTLKASFIFIGRNFCFGKGKKGSGNLLINNGQLFNYKVNILDTFSIDNTAVSSTNIRKFILQGDIEKANRLLGRPYSIRGKIIPGKGLKIGLSTATLEPHHELIPGQGVYAVKVEYKNRKHTGAANIGYAYPYQTYKPTIEIHILDFNEIIYHEFIKVEFIKFIREEKVFSSVEELKKQIEKDIDEIKST